MDIDYMERTVNDKLAAPITLTDDQKKSARTSAMKVIAGFDVHDEAAEKANLDKMIQDRQSQIDMFKKDRAEVMNKLDTLGIVPLAVLPVGAYRSICKDAGLFRFNPDAQGHVRISSGAFASFMTRGTPKEKAEAMAEGFAKNNWPAMLKKYFPDQDSEGLDGVNATLVLPTPPADVIETLMKAQSLVLNTTAVAEAVSFKETPTQLMRRETARREEEARQRALAAMDPIISHDHGSATAVIAQFGEFPIEKKIIDAIVATGDLLARPFSTIAQYGMLSINWGRAVRDSFPGDLIWAHTEGLATIAQRQQFELNRVREQESFFNSRDWTGLI
jgi:hypothetical protein